jgi:hypothetical protein
MIRLGRVSTELSHSSGSVDVAQHLAGQGSSGQPIPTLTDSCWGLQAPIGAERFLAIVKDGGLDGTIIYRVVRNEAVQFGYIKDEAVRAKWNAAPNLHDDKQVLYAYRGRGRGCSCGREGVCVCVCG